MASECKVPATLIFMGTAGRITTEVRLISSEAALSDKGFTLLSDKVLGGARTKYLYQEEKLCPVLHRHGEQQGAGESRRPHQAKAAAKAPAAEPKAKPKEAAKAAAKPKAAPKDAPATLTPTCARMGSSESLDHWAQKAGFHRCQEEPKKPDPKAAAKSKAKAAPEAAKPKEAPKAKADPKAKAGAAKAKAKAEPAPPPPAPEPAPKAKGKAKAAPEPKSSPPKAAAKSKAGAPQKKEDFDMRIPRRQSVWRWCSPLKWMMALVASGSNRRAFNLRKAKGKDQKLIPGMAPINTVPGMAPPKAASKEEIAAFIARAAEKGTAARTAEEEKQAAANALHTQTIKVPENKIGIEKTGVARIDTSGEIFTIAGPQQAVEMAYAAIKDLIEKGYCAMAFEEMSLSGEMNQFDDTHR
eukprot:g17615.t1